MACGITSGIDITCDELRKVGGVNKNAYVTNLSDIDSYTIDGSGYITAITFATYKGLYKFESKKQAHSGGYASQSQDPGGNKFYQHDVILKMFSSTPSDDQVLEDLLVADSVIILETNNKEFKLYGKENGMDVNPQTQNSGQATASDIADSITLIGAEPDMPKRILDTDYATTKALIESYVI
jgi:hypothetical protein